MNGLRQKKIDYFTQKEEKNGHYYLLGHVEEPWTEDEGQWENDLDVLVGLQG